MGAYQLVFPNYEFLLQTLEYFREALQTQLLATALTSHIASHNLTCSDFYPEPYHEFLSLCDSPLSDLTSPAAARLFVQAYLHLSRSSFLKLTAMPSSTASDFLRLDLSSSTFASLLARIQSSLSNHLHCEEEARCSEW